jgi:hypothetical protein
MSKIMNLAGAPLAAEESVSDGRNQVLDQPRLKRPRIGVTMCVQGRQLRIGLRRIFPKILIV